jgi:hypothetical protein
MSAPGMKKSYFEGSEQESLTENKRVYVSWILSPTLAGAKGAEAN